MLKSGIEILSNVKKILLREKIKFHFHTGLMKNPENRKKKEEWHPCSDTLRSALGKSGAYRLTSCAPEWHTNNYLTF